jgi:hypothetical protein
MSATLHWLATALGTKTGTAAANLFADIVTLAGTYSANADYLWEVKGSNTGSTPYYVSFGRKDGSPGRIALLMWTSAPAGNNSAILDGTPTSNAMYVAYFPNGTGTTLANLTASSGTVAGDDTNCVKVAVSSSLSSLYPASFQPFYFECEEAIFFGFANPAGNTFGLGAGELVVDASDTAYGCCIGWTQACSNFGASSAPTICAWTTSANTAGPGGSPVVRTNYGAAGRVYYHAFIPSGTWASAAQSSTDIVSKNETQEFYFAPVPLLGMTKGEGTVLKLRQIGWGPGTVAQLQPYYETGPTLQAIQFCGATTGGNGYPWFVNEKI